MVPIVITVVVMATTQLTKLRPLAKGVDPTLAWYL